MNAFFRGYLTLYVKLRVAWVDFELVNFACGRSIDTLTFVTMNS